MRVAALLMILSILSPTVLCSAAGAQSGPWDSYNTTTPYPARQRPLAGSSYNSLFGQINPLPDDELWNNNRPAKTTGGWAGTASPMGIGRERGVNSASPWGIGREPGANTASPWGIAREPGANTASPMGIAHEPGANSASAFGIAKEGGANTASPFGIAHERGANTASAFGIAKEQGMNSYRNRPSQIRFAPVLQGNYRSGTIRWMYQGSTATDPTDSSTGQ